MHPWIPEEDHLLIDLDLRYENCWKQIATFFEDQTPIQVKSRWDSTLKHKEHASLLDTQTLLDKRARSRACFGLPKTLCK
jgi:hypothetical protein